MRNRHNYAAAPALCAILLMGFLAVGIAQDGDQWTMSFDMQTFPSTGGWFGKSTRAELEEGVLRVVDDSSDVGEGHCFSVNWEAEPEQEAVAEARMKVVSAEGYAGVALWVSNGGSEEGIQFQTDHIKLAFSGLRYDLDTTADFRLYRITVKGEDLKLYVDGELAIDATGKFTHPSHKGRSEFSFGSGSSAAKGESLWKLVRFRSPMVVQVSQIPPEIEHVDIFREDDTYAVFPSIRHDPETDRMSVSFRAGGPRSHIDAKGARGVTMVSEDGAKTWNEDAGLPTPPFSGPEGQQITVACKWWQHFPDTERERLQAEGFMVRDVRPGVVAICWGAYSRRSDDAGATWEQQDIELPPLAFIASGMNSLQLADGTILFPVYATRLPDDPDSSWVLRSTDYGASWDLAHVGTHPDGKTPLNEPEIIEVADGRLMMVMRTGQGSDHLWQAFSDDKGASWHSLRNTGVVGHPPDLLRLRDGRILLSYGHRHVPFGVRAVVSSDNGETWDTDNIWTLREDGGGTDLGYPHSVQLKDGTVVTVYYFMEPGGMQYVACTRWKVP